MEQWFSNEYDELYKIVETKAQNFKKNIDMFTKQEEYFQNENGTVISTISKYFSEIEHFIKETKIKVLESLTELINTRRKALKSEKQKFEYFINEFEGCKALKQGISFSYVSTDEKTLNTVSQIINILKVCNMIWIVIIIVFNG